MNRTILTFTFGMLLLFSHTASTLAASTLRFEFPQYWGGEGTAFVVVAVVRGPDANAPATVDYATANSTALAGSDYTETRGALAFTSEEKLKLVSIPLLNDKLREPNKNFSFRLSNPTGDILGSPSTATITIQDDDPGFGFEVNQAWVHEDQGELLFKVVRGYDPPDEAVMVDYAFTNVTARVGEDYIGGNGTLEFAAGERTKLIRVPVINDNVLEANETFRVLLRNPSAGFLAGAVANQTCLVTIVDATGLEARRFKGIQQMANGAIQLDLAGGVSKPFSNYFSIFQIEASTDLVRWEALPLLGYLNGSTNSPAYVDLPAPGQSSRFYRMNSEFLITPNRPPTGPYPVGVIDRLVTDPSRRNRYRVSTNSSFMISVWYPANPMPGNTLARYWDQALDHDLVYPGASFFDRSPRFKSYSLMDAPLRPNTGGYPVILYSHGGDSYRVDNESLAETLASHGYVVVAPDHRVAYMTQFPDGTVHRIPPEYNPARLQDQVKDLQFLLDTFESIDLGDPILAGFDLTRVAAMGFSFGALTAGEFCRLDNRCRTAISTEWALAAEVHAPDLLNFGLQKPSLMLNASNDQYLGLFSKAIADAYWMQISDTVHGEFSADGWWEKPNNLPATREASRTIHAYTLSFLNKFVKGQDDHLLDGPSPAYPRLINFRKK